MREYVCERERESVCMCVRKGGICGNLLEGITSVIQLARVWFGLFFLLPLFGEAIGEEEYHLVSEYK